MIGLSRSHSFRVATDHEEQVNPTTAGSRKDGAGGNHRRGSHSGASSSIGDVDVASDFEDEPVPYCQSHLEELHDAPTPVGNLVDRVQVGSSIDIALETVGGGISYRSGTETLPRTSGLLLLARNIMVFCLLYCS